MNRASRAGTFLVLVLGTIACSSESASGSGTPSPCEAAFTKLCDKAASCSPTGKVTFISASSGDAGGGSSITTKTAADCKTLYTAGCGSRPPADVPACATAVEAAKCAAQASGEGALVYPVECKQP